MRCFLAIGLALVSTYAAERPGFVSQGVEKMTYLGWADSPRLSAGGRPVRAVLVPIVGGRIIHYGLSGENLLFENPRVGGQTLAAQKENILAGGSWLDLWGTGSSLTERLPLVVGPWRWDSPEDHQVELSCAAEAVGGLSAERDVVMDPETGDVGVVHRVKNVSSREVTCGLWNPTVCRGPGYALLPLARQSLFPAKWAVQQEAGPEAPANPAVPTSAWVKALSGILVVKAGAEAIRLVTDSDAGWLAFVRGKQMLVLHYRSRDPRAPKASVTASLYVDQQVAELGPISPKIGLRPGETFEWPIEWNLIELKREVDSFEGARALASRVKRSPFK